MSYIESGNKKISNTENFYTRNDWGKKDERSIWEDESIDKSNIKIDFVFKDIGENDKIGNIADDDFYT